MKRPLVITRSPAMGASTPLFRALLLFAAVILVQEHLPILLKGNIINSMGVCAMATTKKKSFRTQTSSASPSVPSAQKIAPPPQLPLRPPFPNGLCGGTMLDIAPEETFGVDVNLANFNFMGDMVLLPRKIRVWLPPGYDENDEVGHSVLYVHDGQNAVEDEESWTGASWRLIGALTRLAEHKLICTPYTSNSQSKTKLPNQTENQQRTSPFASSREKLPIVVLLPSADGDWLPGVRRRHLEYGDMNFPFAQAHADFVANTVKPLVDNRFRTDPSTKQTFCMGSSMGGQASLHLLLRHPDKFGGAACLSPAFGPAILNFVDSPKGHKILRDGKKKVYLDIGGDMDDSKSSDFVRVSPIDVLDHLTPVHGWNPGYFWLDTQLQGQVTAMKKALDRAEVDYEYRQYPGGRHNERAWALRIDKPLLHLFSNEPSNTRQRP